MMFWLRGIFIIIFLCVHLEAHNDRGWFQSSYESDESSDDATYESDEDLSVEVIPRDLAPYDLDIDSNEDSKLVKNIFNFIIVQRTTDYEGVDYTDLPTSSDYDYPFGNTGIPPAGIIPNDYKLCPPGLPCTLNDLPPINTGLQFPSPPYIENIGCPPGINCRQPPYAGCMPGCLPPIRSLKGPDGPPVALLKGPDGPPIASLTGPDGPPIANRQIYRCPPGIKCRQPPYAGCMPGCLPPITLLKGPDGPLKKNRKIRRCPPGIKCRQAPYVKSKRCPPGIKCRQPPFVENIGCPPGIKCHQAPYVKSKRCPPGIKCRQAPYVKSKRCPPGIKCRQPPYAGCMPGCLPPIKSLKGPDGPPIKNRKIRRCPPGIKCRQPPYAGCMPGCLPPIKSLKGPDGPPIKNRKIRRCPPGIKCLRPASAGCKPGENCLTLPAGVRPPSPPPLSKCPPGIKCRQEPSRKKCIPGVNCVIFTPVPPELLNQKLPIHFTGPEYSHLPNIPILKDDLDNIREVFDDDFYEDYDSSSDYDDDDDSSSITNYDNDYYGYNTPIIHKPATKYTPVNSGLKPEVNIVNFYDPLGLVPVFNHMKYKERIRECPVVSEENACMGSPKGWCKPMCGPGERELPLSCGAPYKLQYVCCDTFINVDEKMRKRKKCLPRLPYTKESDPLGLNSIALNMLKIYAQKHPKVSLEPISRPIMSESKESEAEETIAKIKLYNYMKRRELLKKLSRPKDPFPMG